MPVYQDLGPGIGAGIDAGVQNYIARRRQKMFDTMAQTQAADAHAGALSGLLNDEIGRTINYGFLPTVQSTGDGTTPAPTSPMPLQHAAALPGGSTAPDNFTADLTGAFAGVPGMSPGSAPADGGGGSPAGARNAMGQQLMQAMARRGDAPPAQTSAQAPSGDPSGNFQSNLATTFITAPANTGLPSYPHERVNLPGGLGSINPMAGFEREAYKQTLLANIKTNADIATAVGTGVVGKNEAEEALARRNAGTLRLGDAGYAGAMGDVAGAESAAKLPSDLALAVRKGQIDLNTALATVAARGKVEAGLQSNQQTFTAGQNNLTRDFQSGQQQREQAAAFVNSSALENQKSRSSILGRMTAASPQTVAPSAAIPGTPASPADLSTQREAWDAAAAALRAQKKDPDTVLPPRP